MMINLWVYSTFFNEIDKGERERKKIASPVQCRNWREITYHDSELRLRLEQALRTFGQVLTFSSSSSIRHGKPIIASFFFQ
jgi:hypothetical protein